MSREQREIWKDVVGYEGIYQVSSLGRVRSVDRTIAMSNRTARLRGRVLKSALTPHGYPMVNLCNRKCTPRKICRLVAEAFIGKRPSGMELRHLDGNKLNSNVNNLAYGTHQENMLDMWAHKTMPHGESTYNHKLTDANVKDIKAYAKTHTKPSHFLAKRYGVHRATIMSILKGKTWKHIA